MTPLPVDRFPPVTLPTLLDEAELLTRFDRKYLLDRQQAESLLHDLDPGTRVLEIDRRRSFRYESVYFDTPDLLSYRQAAHSRRHRFKIRTRSYLDSGLAFLEVKVRGDREITVKNRIEYHPGACDRLTGLGREYAGNTLDQHRMEGSVAGRLAAALTTRYSRITLLPPEPGVRVTLDTDLSWHSAPGPCSDPTRAGQDPRTSLALPDLVIVETKSGGRPSGIDRLLWWRGHRPVSVSKYGTGLAALRSELPSNKWARVLRHHFRTTEELPRAA